MTGSCRLHSSHRRWSAVLATCLSGTVVAVGTAVSADSTVYRYEDDQGIAVFEDRAGAGRHQITLPAVNTYTPAVLKQPAAAPARADAAGTYRSVAVTGPGDGGTIRRNGGNVRVTGRIEPELEAGHTAVLFVDGTMAGSSHAPRVRTGASRQPRDDVEFALTGIARGPHTLRIAILDQEHDILIESATVGFHLLRASAGRRH